MKKKYLIIVTFFGLLTNSYAQELPVSLQKFYCSARLQAMGGGNIGTRSADEYEDGKMGFNPGLNLGLGIKTSLSENVTFTPSIAIDQKGSRYNYDYGHYDPDQMGGASGEFQKSMPDGSYAATATNFANAKQAAQRTDDHVVKTKLTYLSIPLVFGFTPIENVRQVNFIAGLNPGILIGRRTATSVFGMKQEFRGKEGYKTMDLGFLIGAGYRLDNGFSANLVYDHGLVNVLDSEFLSSRNRTVKLIIAYTFNFNPFFKESYTSQRKYLRFY